ncbi:hypothetical protein TNCV_608511 [Trichonephila clavipes]|nr:hypothetical protein TNCV_608511 [Trichonephila clavipes]
MTTPSDAHSEQVIDAGVIASCFSCELRAIIETLDLYGTLPILEQDRVVVYSAFTPQVWGSINGLGKVDSAFHPRYIGSINEYQACLGS